MDDFDEVRTRLRRVNVTAPDYGDAHGVLFLDGENSGIELTGDLPLAEPPAPGWFDLRLNVQDGRTVHIHNAVRTSMTFAPGSNVRSAVLFPNLLVDDATALDADRRCRRISFGLDGWQACFPYNFFKTLSVFGNPPPQLRTSLEEARFEALRNEPFEPNRIYVLNGLGPLIEFEADGRAYSIYASTSSGLGNRDRLDVRARLVGQIVFPEPVTLDKATEACWDWRRYFNQLAMGRLPFTGMAIGASPEPSSPQGNLYLPNQGRPRSPRPDGGGMRNHMPLNRWDERERAREAMRAWLGRQGERRFFRAALDRVLARPGHVAIEDAVALCAGIDTMSELSSRESLGRRVLEAMAHAAVGAAAESGVELDPARVRGLLGSLQNDDLRRRLRRLASRAAPEAKAELLERWIEVIVQLRVFGAHGRIPARDHDLIAGPAVQGLAALCARFDLQEAGVPDRWENRARSLPKLQWDEALEGVRLYHQGEAGPS